jgi:hypothetical protein
VSLEAGYDFLGFNIRRYRNGKLLIKPSKAAIRRVKHKLAEQMRRLRGQNASAVLAAICPITRGWASYYRSVVSKKTFTTVDDYLWQLTYKWACRSHPGNPKHWVVRRYFGRFNRSRQNNWVFGDAASAPPPALAGPHHPAPQGHRPGVPRRPRPDRLLEPAARQEPAPARPQHPAPAQEAARPLRDLRGPAPARRPGASYSRGMATVAPHHPQSDHQAAHRTRTRHHAG